jgi:hypothetical protein
MSDLLPLGDAVLPLIRSRSRDLWRYSVANEHGVQMLDGAALLEQAIRHPQSLNIYGVVEPTPDETYKVAHKALASAIRVIARADDSAGIIGDACRQLIDLHAQAAAQATVSPTKLADWIFDFHFDDQVDYFELDPVAYAPALGPKGLDRLRARVDALRGEIPPHDPDDRLAHYDHREFLVRWFDKRFAVLDRDFEAIIHTHLRDGRVAAWYEDVAAAFEEIGEIDLAIDWSKQATLFGHGHQSQQAARRWQRLLEQHRPQDLPDAVRVVFGRWPSAGVGARVIETSGAGLIPDVQETLLSRPAELVRFQLETMADPRLAWETATRLEIEDDRLWADLAAAYLAIDPIAAISVQLRLVEGSLVEANTRRYRPAARELAAIKRSAAAAGDEALALVNGAIGELRERYRRRPSLIAALDRARLG